MNNWFRKIMGKGVPVLIRYDAFWSYKVSKLPSSSHHSLKAANIFKADILFIFISKKIIKIDKVKAELN